MKFRYDYEMSILSITSPDNTWAYYLSDKDSLFAIKADVIALIETNGMNEIIYMNALHSQKKGQFERCDYFANFIGYGRSGGKLTRSHFDDEISSYLEMKKTKKDTNYSNVTFLRERRESALLNSK